ncbi:16_t:CDS:1, partial [Paraglomus occultum]
MSALPSSLCVHVVTYNLNKQLLCESLESLLVPSPEASSRTPDIVAIGFQELAPYPQAFLGESTHILNHYTHIISRTLKSATNESFTQIVRTSLIGVALFIFARDSTCTPFVKITEVNTVGLGWLWMGDKAAVGARVLIAEDGDGEVGAVSMCFVTAHLAAHNRNFQLRNKQFKEVCNRLVFSSTKYDDTSMETFHVRDSSYLSTSSSVFSDDRRENLRKLTIYDNDYTFFFGDLNYRILLSHPTLPTISVPDILTMMRNNHMDQLREYDQLAIAHGEEKTLNNFTESPILFPPTYKLYRETNDYNVLSRIPGWCDRIFSLQNCSSTTDDKCLVVECYSSHAEYSSSDHKPVSATVKVSTSSVSHERIYDWDETDSYWRIKQKIGMFADRIVGIVWWSFGTGPGFGITLLISTITGY